MESGLGRREEDETIGVATHTCVETTQGNSLCSYLYVKLSKTLVFLFIFYVFSSTKLENRKAKQILPECVWGCWVALVGGRRWWGKG
jgi:hypothetical protein